MPTVTICFLSRVNEMFVGNQPNESGWRKRNSQAVGADKSAMGAINRPLQLFHTPFFQEGLDLIRFAKAVVTAAGCSTGVA